MDDLIDINCFNEYYDLKNRLILTQDECLLFESGAILGISTSEYLINKLKEYMKEHKLRQADIARMLGIADSACHRILHTTSSLYDDTKLKIERLLG